MMYYLYIAIFSALGGMLRYEIGLMIGEHGFPYATLSVNLLGCFLLAFVLQFLAANEKIPSEIIAGLGTGFVGAFTTFSSFSVESVQLFTNGNYVLLIIYISISLIGGLLSARLGYALSHYLLAKKEGQTS